MLLKFLVVCVEISEFIWQDVRIRNEIEILLSELFLHPHHVVAERVLPRDFVTLREVVQFLILVQPLVNV